jgi:hypothetical protein
VSVRADGTQADGDTWYLYPAQSAMDASGRHIVYNTSASNLAPTDGNTRQHVLRYDQVTRRSEVVSRGRDGTAANGDSFSPTVDAAGLLVAHESSASNLVAGDTNGWRDAFVTTARRGW